MYKALVRSHIDYCDIIYHILPPLNQPSVGISLNYLMEEVEKIQYQAALVITAAWQGSNRSRIYEEVGLEFLSDRRIYRRILQIYKIINNMTPSYLTDKLPPNRRPYIFSADISNTLREIRRRSSRYMNRFFPNGVVSWNVMITHFKIMPSIGKLKEHLISLFRANIKSTFEIHDTIGLRYIFQLRLRLSPLRSHKWCHNFQDIVTDTCNYNLDTDHCLFSCPFFGNSNSPSDHNCKWNSTKK